MENKVWIRTEPNGESQAYNESMVPGKFGRKFDWWMTRAVWEELDLDTDEGREKFLNAQYVPVATVDDANGLTVYLHEDVPYYTKAVRTLHFPKGETPVELKGHCVDALISMDGDGDRRLVGVQFWSTPGFSSDPLRKQLVEQREYNQKLIDRVAALGSENYQLRMQLEDAVARPMSDKVCIVVSDAMIQQGALAAYERYTHLSEQGVPDEMMLAEVLKAALDKIPGLMVLDTQGA